MIDVIVIGGGHAGTEAAAAAARCGAQTLLITGNPRTIGAMSCNPSIGGLGKGHIVREIDAFDGVMARAADGAAIHYRMLNRSKGAAVRGPRIQADRRRYATAVQSILAATPALSIVHGDIIGFAMQGDIVTGVDLADGMHIDARAIILATGTFLGGRMYRGEERWEGGRLGDHGANRLADQLQALALPMARLKTGTPPRLDGRTIDWARLEPQPSDREPWTMSAMSEARGLPQVACAITRTGAAAHEAIRGGLDRSPLFGGAIEGGGPRYCPSIEDKVVRFGDRDGHQVFLEPEGLDDTTVYPNGLSTSLPTDVQQRLVASIPGLEAARIVVPGYAVEYAFCDPRALTPALTLKALKGLFLAGQINGTTGYEEAAGQGLIAGINAARFAMEQPPLVLDRASSYIGVMIDDLVLQGVTEPYRMLTARAEYRLSLRADNAETRLGPIAQAAGCIGPERLAHQHRRSATRAAWRDRLDRQIPATTLSGWVSQDGSRRSAFEWLRHDGMTPALLIGTDDGSPELAELVEDARYAPYLERQAEEIETMRRNEALALPMDLRFDAIPGLSNEMVERLTIARPHSLGAASRIRGVTPAALSAILLHARRLAA